MVINPYVAANEFASDFGNLEYAMKRSGFLRKNKKVAEADWNELANVLGQDFFTHICAIGIAETLISQPPRRQLANMEWSPAEPEPLTNSYELLVNGVCRVRNSYFHGEKFRGGPEGQWERDTTLIVEAHAVLKEVVNSWSHASTNRETPR